MLLFTVQLIGQPSQLVISAAISEESPEHNASNATSTDMEIDFSNQQRDESLSVLTR
jgi:hypothetical protein